MWKHRLVDIIFVFFENFVKKCVKNCYEIFDLAVFKRYLNKIVLVLYILFALPSCKKGLRNLFLIEFFFYTIIYCLFPFFTSNSPYIYFKQPTQ